MKSITALLAILVHSMLFSQTDSTGQFVEEDQILQQIQLDQPSEPVIRFGAEQINLLGKWCYAEIDSNSFVLSKIPDSIVPTNCLAISLGYWGFVEGGMNRSFSVIDSVFQFHFFPEEHYFTKSYFISQHHENQLVFNHLKTERKTVQVEPMKQWSVSLVHRFKRKTAELSLDRIFGISVDSISYRGDVVQLMDSVITFHAYFVEGTAKDSIYRFPLDSLSGISYYTAKHPERFFEKNRIPPSKAQENVDDAFRVIGCISVMSILATVISSAAGKDSYEGDTNIKEKVDPALAHIGFVAGLLNISYCGVMILHRSLITDQYDLTEEWSFINITL